MQILTIPKQAFRDDVILIPRKHYEDLIRVSEKHLDHDLEQSIREVREGKSIGPFKSAPNLMRALKGKT